MLSRVFLAAGVAALAIATPLAAKPGGGHGNGGDKGGAPAQQGGGGGGGHGHGGGGGQAVFTGGGGGGHGQGGGGFAAPKQQRVERQQVRAVERQGGFERQQARSVERQRGFERQQARAVERQRGVERQQARNFERQRGVERQQARSFERQRGVERQQARNFERQRGFERQQAKALERQRGFERQQTKALDRQQAQNFAQGKRFEQAQQRIAANSIANAEQIHALRNARTSFVDNVVDVRTRGLIDGCPPGLWMKNNGCMPPGQAARFLGAPLATAAGIASLGLLPQSLGYFYPDTSDYYYRYGDGYLYQVDRDTSLIASLLPLIGGGYLPGSYLPAAYMNSYVPDYYGFNSFYPDYGDQCNRYYYGVIYQVGCDDGFVESTIPMYAGGYGVGQLLPSAYSHYNVPMQYRSLYYDTPDYGYYYAPGAIYQYDPRSSAITSVAALLSPGFSIGQQLPLGYDVYNVPYDYRATYYDTPNASYRYNNGYIYQVDPVTQIVTAIVASLLT